MRWRTVVSEVVAVMAVLALTVMAVSEEGGAMDQPKPTEKDRVEALLKEPRKLYASEYDIRSLSHHERQVLAMYRYERDIERLGEQTLNGVELTDLQKRTIRGMLQAQIDEVHASEGRPSTKWRPHPKDWDREAADPAADAGGVKSKARQVGPDPAGRSTGTSALAASVYDDPTFLLDRIKRELSAEQKPDFVKIGERWRILKPFGVADGPLRQLVRAVRDPALTVSDEARAEYLREIQAKMKELTRQRRRYDRSARLQAFRDVKAALISTMTPEQRQHFERTLHELQTVYAKEILMIQDLRAAERAAKTKAEDAKKSDAGKSDADDRDADKTPPADKP